MSTFKSKLLKLLSPISQAFASAKETNPEPKEKGFPSEEIDKWVNEPFRSFLHSIRSNPKRYRIRRDKSPKFEYKHREGKAERFFVYDKKDDIQYNAVVVKNCVVEVEGFDMTIGYHEGKILHACVEDIRMEAINRYSRLRMMKMHRQRKIEYDADKQNREDIAKRFQ